MMTTKIYYSDMNIWDHLNLGTPLEMKWNLDKSGKLLQIEKYKTL